MAWSTACNWCSREKILTALLPSVVLLFLVPRLPRGCTGVPVLAGELGPRLGDCGWLSRAVVPGRLPAPPSGVFGADVFRVVLIRFDYSVSINISRHARQC